MCESKSTSWLSSVHAHDRVLCYVVRPYDFHDFPSYCFMNVRIKPTSTVTLHKDLVRKGFLQHWPPLLPEMSIQYQDTRMPLRSDSISRRGIALQPLPPLLMTRDLTQTARKLAEADRVCTLPATKAFFILSSHSRLFPRSCLLGPLLIARRKPASVAQSANHMARIRLTATTIGLQPSTSMQEVSAQGRSPITPTRIVQLRHVLLFFHMIKKILITLFSCVAAARRHECTKKIIFTSTQPKYLRPFSLGSPSYLFPKILKNILQTASLCRRSELTAWQRLTMLSSRKLPKYPEHGCDTELRL